MTGGSLQLSRSAVFQNNAVNGGGLAVTAGVTNMVNDTLARNAATMVGGAIHVAGDAALNVSFASMADNVTGDPLSAALHNVVGTVNVKNSS